MCEDPQGRTVRAARRRLRGTRGLAAAVAAGIAGMGDAGGVESGGPQTAVIEAISLSGMAPFTVHVNGLGSTLGAGDALDARFEWDFGDPGALYNELEGWNGAHIYDDPGTYVVTLRVTNSDGQTATTFVSVSVSPDTRTRLYVAANGDDGHDGLTPQSAIRTFGRMREVIGDDTTALFRRGDVFPVDDDGDINRVNWVIGAYGTGVLPELRWTGSLGLNQFIAMNGEYAHDVVIQDLHFDSIYPDTSERNIASCVFPAGHNITVRRCTFGHVTDAINCERQPTGVLGMDNVASVPNGLRAYFTWVRGSDHTYLGNVVNGSLIEHCVRVAGADRVNLSYNHLTNNPKTVIWVMLGEYTFMRGNTLRDGPVAIGPNPHLGSPSERMRYTVLERNHFIKATTGPAAIEFHPGAESHMLRGNVIEATGQSCIDINGWDPANQRTCVDIRILNNTGVNPSSGGRFLDVEAGTQNVTVRNSLYAAPNMVTGQGRTASMYVAANGLSGFSSIRGNTWAIPDEFAWIDDAYHYVWPSWSHPSGYLTPAQWDAYGVVSNEAYTTMSFASGFVPPEDDVAAENGVAVAGVYVDYYGTAMPSAGPWPSGAASATGTAPPPDGDIDGDGAVGTSDLLLLVKAWGVDHPLADLDQNGVVDVADLSILIGLWDAGVLPGDLNADGIVGAADLMILMAAWGTSDPGADINADGIVDSFDLILLIVQWNE